MNYEKNYQAKRSKYGRFNVFVNNFPDDWNEDRIEEVFSKHGKIISIKMLEKKALILFEDKESFDNAISTELHKEYDGVKLFVAKYQDKSALSHQIERRRYAKKMKKVNAEEVKEGEEVRESDEEKAEEIEAETGMGWDGKINLV